ncbi:MAG: hypothetical protein HY805_05720 [Nitrospirae bacterium]|nr:hypothetical protein [Nitrospirota bacterium]
MGEFCQYQPLTRWEKVTVVLYRAGIAMSCLIAIGVSFMLLKPSYFKSPLLPIIMLGLLYMSTGMSVLSIHLYVRKYKETLKILYSISALSGAVLFILSKGDVLWLLATPYGPLFLIPLSCCLGFITAKEAFCFKLYEGYILALIMPFYLIMLSLRGLRGIVPFYGFLAIAFLLLLFTLRKVFMPLHCDIGDKTAYQ